jgi:hypothetical protein
LNTRGERAGVLFFGCVAGTFVGVAFLVEAALGRAGTAFAVAGFFLALVVDFFGELFWWLVELALAAAFFGAVVFLDSVSTVGTTVVGFLRRRTRFFGAVAGLAFVVGAPGSVVPGD